MAINILGALSSVGGACPKKSSCGLGGFIKKLLEGLTGACGGGGCCGKNPKPCCGASALASSNSALATSVLG